MVEQRGDRNMLTGTTKILKVAAGNQKDNYLSTASFENLDDTFLLYLFNDGAFKPFIKSKDLKIEVMRPTKKEAEESLWQWLELLRIALKQYESQNDIDIKAIKITSDSIESEESLN
jgi:hypothetical protein